MLIQALAAFGRARRVPRTGIAQLNSKRGPRNYYKGKGVQPTGRHTRKGGYILDKLKLPNFVVPDLTGFTLKPYVALKDPPPPKKK
mmetsp:Transcript_10179/g.30619  ORF Transcript_10179/g.30619 Transcript_10179/m.30619 type:complete len:86 (-) Transcript_10179:2447-2704(-)